MKEKLKMSIGLVINKIREKSIIKSKYIKAI